MYKEWLVFIWKYLFLKYCGYFGDVLQHKSTDYFDPQKGRKMTKADNTPEFFTDSLLVLYKQFWKALDSLAWSLVWLKSKVSFFLLTKIILFVFQHFFSFYSGTNVSGLRFRLINISGLRLKLRNVSELRFRSNRK